MDSGLPLVVKSQLVSDLADLGIYPGGIVDWEGGDYFPVIVGESLAAGHGRAGTVGAAPSYLLDAAPLHEFAIGWLEGRFGGRFAGC